MNDRYKVDEVGEGAGWDRFYAKVKVMSNDISSEVRSTQLGRRRRSNQRNLDAQEYISIIPTIGWHPLVLYKTQSEASKKTSSQKLGRCASRRVRSV